eukprot:171739_1
MAFLYSDLTEVSPYLKARKKFYTPEAWQKMINALKTSTTLYIGNLSFYTDEEQVYTLFSLCGPVRRVIMGIHKYTHLPCGFCFVEYYFHRDAMAARNYLNGTKLDDRIVRVDLDPGFEPGRQFGRGTTGGQVRDDRRREYDEGRGGLPPRHKQRLEKHAIASGTLIAPTNGPLHNNHQNRHRYERNMSVNQSTNNNQTNNKEQKEEKKEMSTNNNNKKNDDIKVENNSNGNVKNDNENGRINDKNDDDNKDNKKEDMQVDTQVDTQVES